jgi:hypothetical protein
VIIVCTDGCYWDMSVLLVEHTDAAEALDVLRSLDKHDHPEPVGFAEHMTIVDDSRVAPLAEIVAGYLDRAHGKALFDTLPIGVLRAAVAHTAGTDDAPKRYPGGKALREALFLREQRDRIAADLAVLEKIGAMTVEGETQ